MDLSTLKPVEIPSIEWAMLWPVIAVMLTGIAALLIEMFRPKQDNGPIVWVSLVGLAATFFLLVPELARPEGETFARMFLRDQAAVVMQMIMVASCFLCFCFSESYLREKRAPFAEFYPLALWSTAGGMLMVSSQNLLMLFLGIEVLSIALYCMAGMARQEAKSEESALKYFLLGAFSSAFLLYGIAFLFGASGSLHLEGIGQVWAEGTGDAKTMLVFGLGLILVGLGFKASLVPFHQWTPDVYQGAPTNVTAFMAAVSKIAAIGALYRVLDASLDLSSLWLPVVTWLAILTMSIGNLVALVQRDVKRALGYSSIAHAGYLLVALIAHWSRPEEVGIGTTLYYLLAYSLATIGAFAVVTLVAKDGEEGTRFQDLNGLWHRAPIAAAVLVVCMASLIGAPITAGFVGKLQIFFDAQTAGLTPLAIVLAVNSIVSVYYYLGIIAAVFVREREEGSRENQAQPTFGLQAAAILCLVGVIGAAIFATPLQKFWNPTPEVEAATRPAPMP